ncbi:Ig-like domain-containing protein [Geodermatophilus sabuli]|uniref:Ig-like domain-containing protein n=1 Tax=Geodermatophilus sabuli TaxID=1564158 RepID=A0A7K3W189_9ACTN|nr:Ig-like domain-containing protein [Geodermatophilus sabuli]
MAASTVALLAPALVGTAPASASLTGPGVGPNKNITVFHNLDFVGVFGYGTVGSTVRVEVIRAGAVIGVAQGPAWSTDEGVGLEVNHGLEAGTPQPGDCWAGGTPDIKPGDRVVVYAGTTRNEVTVDDIRWTGAPESADENGNGVADSIVVRGVAKRFDGTVIPPSALDSGEFRNESGKYRATPDVIEADPGVDGGFVARYRAPYLGFRNSDGLTEAQRKQALLTEDGHAIGIGHTEPLPRESMLVDGLADVPGPAVGCEDFSQDLLPPKPVSQTPAPDTRDVGRLSNVTVGFDEPVTGLSNSTFTLSASNGTAVTAGVAYNRTTGVATLNPFPGTTDPLASGTRYTATVSETVTDAAGNPLPKTSWSFVTSGEGPDNDRAAPTIASRTPESGATGVARGANVLIGMSEAVAKPDSTSVWLESPDGSKVPAAVNVNATTNTVIVNPDADLAAGTTYEVVLTDGVKDLAGNQLTPTTWTFTTSGTASGDTVPPTVSSQSPAPDASGVAKGANVLVGMSEPVVKPDSSSVWLEAPDGAKVPAVVNYNATSNTVIVNPDSDLAAGRYRAVLTDGVRDAAGNKLAPTSWTFTVGVASTDTVAPTLTSRTPAPDAANVGLASNVFMVFSEPIVKPDDSTVWLEAPDGSKVTAAVNYYASSNTVILNPGVDLTAKTTYTVVLTAGVKDLAGLSVAPEEWAFTTR